MGPSAYAASLAKKVSGARLDFGNCDVITCRWTPNRELLEGRSTAAVGSVVWQSAPSVGGVAPHVVARLQVQLPELGRSGSPPQALPAASAPVAGAWVNPFAAAQAR